MKVRRKKRFEKKKSKTTHEVQPEFQSKLNPQWIRQTRQDFRAFLNETKFPDPVRMGRRGPEFNYPEWLIMFIAIVAVKAKVKSYVGIHRLCHQHWKEIASGMKLKPISERQLRDRLKKIGWYPTRTPAFILQVIPKEVLA